MKVSPRLLVISEFSGASIGVTAAGSRVQMIRDFLSSNGWVCFTVSPVRGQREGQVGRERRIDEVIAYDSWRERLGSPLALLFAPINVFRFLRKMSDVRPWVVMISGYSPFIFIEPLIAAKILGLPTVLDVMDSWILLSAFHPGRLRNRLRILIERFGLRRGDLTIGVTGTQVKMMQSGYGLAIGKTMVVPRGVPSVPHEIEGDVQKTLDLIHSGPPRDYYDNDGILEALGILASRIPSLRCAFLGVAGESELATLRRELARRGLDRNVVVLPPVAPAAVVKEVRKARLGLISLTRHPAYRAAISTKSYDYVCAPIPIAYLGPEDSEQAALIRDHQIGIVASTPTDFANRVELLLRESTLRKEFEENARRAARELDPKRSMEEFGKRLLALAGADGSVGTG